VGAGYPQGVIDGKSLAPRRVSTGSGGMAGHQDQPRVQDRSFAFSTVHYRSCCFGVREIGSCGVARQQRPPLLAIIFASPRRARAHRKLES
jgi:hypothetical protein